MSKQQKIIPVFLCGRCPVPAPAGSAVDLWQPGKADSKTPHHPSQKVDRSAGSVRECRGDSSSQEDLYYIYVLIIIDFNNILNYIQD